VPSRRRPTAVEIPMPDDPLARRLLALERAHRRLRRAVGALLLVLLGAALLGAADDGILRGRSLQLRDDQGRVRVLLAAATGLSILDTGGAPRAVLGLDGEGPGLVLYGDASRAILNVNRDGPALAFTGARGKLHAIFATVRGEPGLVFFDAQERERLQLAVRGGGGRGELRAADGAVSWRAPAP